MFAVLFLGISIFLEFLCVLLYAYLFPKLPIVKYYRSKAASEGSKTVSADLAAAGIQTPANQEVLLLFFNLSLLVYLHFIG
jgi:equilibrative nucleoside transporter 1/2/3